MHLFYDQGKPQLTMPLEEFLEAIGGAQGAKATLKSMLNGSDTRSAKVGRGRMARKSTGRRRMVSRKPMKAKRKRLNWGAIVAKRKATMARRQAKREATAPQESMAATQ